MIAASDGYEGVTVAGLLVVARDTGAMLLTQRAFDETDAPEVAETWEMPGGHLDSGEDAFSGALREFTEEVGVDLPAHEVVHGWRAGPEDNYQGFLVAVDEQFAVDPASADPMEVQNVLWATPEEASTLNLRPEFAKLDLAALIAMVSGNEDEMDDETQAADEPDFTTDDIHPVMMKIHGILAPEETESGDARGFNDGSVTARPYRLPFSWQKAAIGGHDGSVVVGSVDRLMRKDGMIHYEGTLMANCEADELTDLIAFFGKFGVSVDGDRGSLDAAKTNQTGVTWFDAVRAAGLTAVAIPAFSEAYVSLGPHPDMPALEDGDVEETLAASGLSRGDIVTFDRGPGWITNPKETNRIHDYWTKKGEPGYAKIGWGTPGDFRRAKALIGEKIAKNSPEKMKYLNQIIAQWHFDALGYWPGDLDKPGNKTSAEARAEREAKDLAASEHGIVLDADDASWEAVLVSSASSKRPPIDYFHEHPDSAGTVIEEPDENGFQRTYGMAAEWGVCHIGMEGRCVEPPQMGNDDYPDFHKGRTKVEGGFIPTGLLTYNVEHRDAERILTESATQSHFDNLKNAWAAVRIGENERGIWFSGVVLPKVDPEDLVKIEASGQVSGEWKYGALRALLTVNVEGFPIERASAAYDEEGNVVALAASAFGQIEDAPCNPTPAERMAALKAACDEADAEERFARLKEGWV